MGAFGGDVKIEYKDVAISGDYAEFDMNRKVVAINGSVRVAMGEEEMKGESAVSTSLPVRLSWATPGRS